MNYELGIMDNKKIQKPKVKMIVAQQKFLKEIFAEPPKFLILHFEF
jgi:hypothetical protein